MNVIDIVMGVLGVLVSIVGVVFAIRTYRGSKETGTEITKVREETEQMRELLGRQVRLQQMTNAALVVMIGIFLVVGALAFRWDRADQPQTTVQATAGVEPVASRAEVLDLRGDVLDLRGDIQEIRTMMDELAASTGSTSEDCP